MSLKEFANRHDRPLWTIGTAIGVLCATYIGATRYIDNIVERAKVISELKMVNAVQGQINKDIDEKFSRLDMKIDSIYRYVIRK